MTWLPTRVWPTDTIQSVCARVTDGKHGDCRDEPGSGYYFLSCKDIFNGRLNYDQARQIAEVDFLDTHRRTQLEPDDVLITNSGTIGRLALVPDRELTRRTVFQKSVAILKPVKARVEPRFLYYALQSDVRRLIDFAGGTAQKNLLLRDLRNFEIPVPPLAIQRRIADILSSYDDLIENCDRRIRVLDEMARAHFREWFVHFRYPVHEQTPLVESPLGRIPKGWEASSLNGLLDLDTGKRPKGGAVGAEDGVPSVGAENVKGIGYHDYGSEKYVPRAFFEEMRRGVVRDRDVALYKDGAYIGRSTYFRDGFPHAEFAVNEHVFLLRPSDTRLGSNRLYLWLQQPETVVTIRSKNANAAQPGINRGIVQGLSIVLPPVNLATQFEEFSDPYLALIIQLAKWVRILHGTRDLLLPRLLSGQLSVEDAA